MGFASLYPSYKGNAWATGDAETCIEGFAGGVPVARGSDTMRDRPARCSGMAWTTRL